MLYEPPKTKKYIIIGAAALVVLALVFWSVQKMKPKPVSGPPVQVQKTIKEKQKEMVDTIDEANNSDKQNPLPEEEKSKRRQETKDTINTANTEAPKISEEEAAKRQQDMLEAINESNNRPH